MDFRVSISLLLCEVCINIEKHTCTRIWGIKKYNNSHVNQTVRPHALHAIYICWGRCSPIHLEQNYRFIIFLIIQNRISRPNTVFLTLYQPEIVFSHTFNHTESSWTLKTSSPHVVENQNDFLVTYPIFMSYTVLVYLANY